MAYSNEQEKMFADSPKREVSKKSIITKNRAFAVAGILVGCAAIYAVRPRILRKVQSMRAIKAVVL